MSPFILIPDIRWGMSSASGTSRYAPGEKSGRCPINSRLSWQKGRYGSFGGKSSCLYQKLNQEPWFSSPLPSYNTDWAVPGTRWVSAWIYNFYITQRRLSSNSVLYIASKKKACRFWKSGGNLNWLQIIKGLKISSFWVCDGTRNVQRLFTRKPSTTNSVSMGKIIDRNVAKNTVMYHLQGIEIQWSSSRIFSLLVHFPRIIAVGLKRITYNLSFLLPYQTLRPTARYLSWCSHVHSSLAFI